ncbi:acyl-CoA thioesterase [Burkholderia ubonensis]|uniref:acyl-CoA thioesterase n=1 Tax=Burkholderia ubonensis TaxID=101571 RepID=UPI000752555C|nr:thioesterase family protein [Burkholderia ubonensis]KVG23667.1 hypothetical protein WJ29_00940 [Burkholderia ubonensis]OJA66962.1 hypothetical protein BGV70_13465 [Burkholderia ubonensis]
MNEEGVLSVGGVFETEKLIRFQHCDPAGIVFYPQYFVLFHELIEDWFNDGLNVNYADFVSNQKLGVPTARIEVDFIAPSKIGDILQMSLAVKRLGRSSIGLSLSAFGDEGVRVRIEQTVVLFSLDRREPVAIPEELRARLALFMIRSGEQ